MGRHARAGVSVCDWHVGNCCKKFGREEKILAHGAREAMQGRGAALLRWWLLYNMGTGPYSLY